MYKLYSSLQQRDYDDYICKDTLKQSFLLPKKRKDIASINKVNNIKINFLLYFLLFKLCKTSPDKADKQKPNRHNTLVGEQKDKPGIKVRIR